MSSLKGWMKKKMMMKKKSNNLKPQTMTTTKVTCAECGQTAFADVLKHWEGKDVCHSCYEKMFASKYNWGNDSLAM